MVRPAVVRPAVDPAAVASPNLWRAYRARVGGTFFQVSDSDRDLYRDLGGSCGFGYGFGWLPEGEASLVGNCHDCHAHLHDMCRVRGLDENPEVVRGVAHQVVSLVGLWNLVGLAHRRKAHHGGTVSQLAYVTSSCRGEPRVGLRLGRSPGSTMLASWLCGMAQTLHQYGRGKTTPSLKSPP